MNPFRSIRWRLQLWYGLLMAGLLAGFGLTAYFYEKNVRLKGIDDELERLAFAMNTTTRHQGPPPPEGRSGPVVPTPAQVITPELTARGFYHAIWRRNGVPFTPAANAPTDLPKPPDGPPALRWRGTRREAYIVSNPGDVALVGRDLAEEMAALRVVGWKLAGTAASIFTVTLLVGGWLISRSLRPIHDISAAATSIAAGDLSRRIDTHDTDSELGQLAAVLNSTFRRLETAFAQQAQFTADAAHELRTPLTVMLTHVQIGLGTEGLTPEQREAFEACQRAAQRMRRLIESLLALSRLDAGQEPLQTAPLDLAEVARDCVDLVQPLAAGRKINVQADTAVANCHGDRERLEQVLTNLLANAIHHNRDGGVVRVQTRAANGNVFAIVSDDGPGIAPEHLPHIFERFYRADQARTSAQGRTGLGLAISRAIVEAHGGAIDVASHPGAGATFTVRLPV